MGSRREKQRIWPAVGVLAISALAHLALLFLPLPGLRDETPRSEPPSLSVELVARPPAPEPRADVPPPSEPPEPAIENPAEPDRPAPAEAAPIESTPSSEPQAGPASSATLVDLPEQTPEAIRTQLLGAARDLGRESEQSDEAVGLTYQGTPELPSQPGWLHQYTGRVRTSIDRWKSSDGSRSARVVTGSGQVYCIRTRAPTIAETFNPWMSSAVAMVSGCGRERPQAPDGTDPWLRRPGEMGNDGLGN